jgi:hypothetical protein
MQERPTCPDCAGPLWLVVPKSADTPTHFECFHCHQPPEPEQQQGVAVDLRNAFRNLKRRIARCVMANTSAGTASSYDTSRGRAQHPRRGAKMLKPIPSDAIRTYSFVYCRCGRANPVQNVKPDDKIGVFCVGCGHSLKYQPGDVRRGSVAVGPSLSLRDFEFGSRGGLSGLAPPCGPRKKAPTQRGTWAIVFGGSLARAAKAGSQADPAEGLAHETGLLARPE